MVVYPISLNRVPGCLFKITAKRRGGGGRGGGRKGALIGRKALNQGGHLSSFPFKVV